MRLRTHIGILSWTTIFIAAAGVATEPLHIRQEFYVVVAQVLPVFLLVAAVEGRFYLERPVYGPLRKLLVNHMLFLALIGEIFALAAVARGAASTMERGGVLIGLFIVGFQFMTFASLGPVAASPEPVEDQPSR